MQQKSVDKVRLRNYNVTVSNKEVLKMETKEDILRRMSKKFISLEMAELKSYAIMNMISYEAGKAVGEEEERMKQETNKHKKEKSTQHTKDMLGQISIQNFM